MHVMQKNKKKINLMNLITQNNLFHFVCNVNVHLNVEVFEVHL